MRAVGAALSVTLPRAAGRRAGARNRRSPRCPVSDTQTSDAFERIDPARSAFSRFDARRVERDGRRAVRSVAGAADGGPGGGRLPNSRGCRVRRRRLVDAQAHRLPGRRLARPARASAAAAPCSGVCRRSRTRTAPRRPRATCCWQPPTCERLGSSARYPQNCVPLLACSGDAARRRSRRRTSPSHAHPPAIERVVERRGDGRARARDCRGSWCRRTRACSPPLVDHLAVGRHGAFEDRRGRSLDA